MAAESGTAGHDTDTAGGGGGGGDQRRRGTGGKRRGLLEQRVEGRLGGSLLRQFRGEGVLLVYQRRARGRLPLGSSPATEPPLEQAICALPRGDNKLGSCRAC